MTRHTLRPGTACVHPVRDNIVELPAPPDVPYIDAAGENRELRAEIWLWERTSAALLIIGAVGWLLWLM